MWADKTRRKWNLKRGDERKPDEEIGGDDRMGEEMRTGRKIWAEERSWHERRREDMRGKVQECFQDFLKSKAPRGRQEIQCRKRSVWFTVSCAALWCHTDGNMWKAALHIILCWINLFANKVIQQVLELLLIEILKRHQAVKKPVRKLNSSPLNFDLSKLSWWVFAMQHDRLSMSIMVSISFKRENKAVCALGKSYTLSNKVLIYDCTLILQSDSHFPIPSRFKISGWSTATLLSFTTGLIN